MGLTVCDGSAAAENNYLVELDHTTATRCYERLGSPQRRAGIGFAGCEPTIIAPMFGRNAKRSGAMASRK